LNSSGRAQLPAHQLRKALRGPEIKVPPFQGGTYDEHSIGRPVSVNSSIGLADAAKSVVFAAGRVIQATFPTV
jgi:hypothetical protein